jgi:hypothetical protein
MTGGVTISLDFNNLVNAFELKFSVYCQVTEIIISRSQVVCNSQITNDRRCLAADYLIRGAEKETIKGAESL